MIFIGQYNELIPGNNYPSIMDFISDAKYEGQGKIIHYLTHGKKDILSSKIPKDIFTGKPIQMSMQGMNDGEHSWFTILAYYVEHYNLRLPKSFEDKILNS